MNYSPDSRYTCRRAPAPHERARPISRAASPAQSSQPDGHAVSFAYREFSVNDDVQLNVETEPHFPSRSISRVPGQPARGRQLPFRCDIGKFEDCRPQLVACVVMRCRMTTPAQSKAPVIGRLPSRPSQQSDRDADKCKGRGYRVTAVVRCVALLQPGFRLCRLRFRHV
jgi:hypothetical protein